MPDKTIVLVSDLDNSTHGEVHVLDDGHEAARLVENLLEAGFGSERIRVFAVDELEMQITHRPVVALVSSAASAPVTAQEETPAPFSPEEDEQRRLPAAPRAEHLGVSAVPYMRDGVRFSTLFRPA